jgi:hypothetical protein
VYKEILNVLIWILKYNGIDPCCESFSTLIAAVPIILVIVAVKDFYTPSV